MTKRLYDLINPSDAITFRATPEEAAVLAEIMRASMLYVRDAETGDDPKVEDVAATREAIWADPERQASYADAFRSFLIGTKSERELFEEATSRMTASEAADYRDKYHDRRRTSMNDICAALWERAEQIATYKRPE